MSQLSRERAAAATTITAEDDEDEGGLVPVPVSPEEDGELREPPWLARLLDEFDVPPREGQRFVETRVRAAPKLAGQLAALSRCVVCLDSPRGAVLQPCSHAQFCGCCAQRVVGELSRCPVCAGLVTGWARVFL